MGARRWRIEAAKQVTRVEEDDVTDGNSSEEKGHERMGKLKNFTMEVMGGLNRNEHE